MPTFGVLRPKVHMRAAHVHDHAALLGYMGVFLNDFFFFGGNKAEVVEDRNSKPPTYVQHEWNSLQFTKPRLPPKNKLSALHYML